MESLAETPWDVTISGTGLAQSLLALALSRSGKKVLHVDRNPFYGGSEAAFSLQEAEDWAARVNHEPESFPVEDVTIFKPQQSADIKAHLGPSRAYTLTLSPQLIYCRSRLLPTLVSSKVYRQLEFQAVGSWWISKPSDEAVTGASTNSGPSPDLYRVPSSREDVFADDVMNVKSKRTLMRFLRHIAKPPQDEAVSGAEDLSGSFPDYLSSKFQMPSQLYDPLLSLSLAQASPLETSAEYAVARIKRHLTSIGVFGPGFGSLLAKWGGGSEIAQVGCRALAVGGGVYVLDAGIDSVKDFDEPDSGDSDRVQVHLSNEESIKTRFLVGSNWDLPADVLDPPRCDKASRSITIVSSSLENLFPVTAEGGPIPAGAVVVFPGNTLGQKDDSPPVYILVHSSETGECPPGQSVLYSSVSMSGPDGQLLLEKAVQKLLESSSDLDARILWSLRYTQLGRAGESMRNAQAAQLGSPSANILCFPPPSLDLAFDDTLIDVVKDAWRRIVGDDAPDDFMKFEDREGISDAE
ncbi:putative Rab geranylgeranyl transferase escort protein [Aspergillus clavatus NRRL 1]|uniref:Rab proteins geranylgeranyltransferase n=1 Tax=Aspergillus clavatus (strain ATCC 1007 / CBS 513.65 / DSM 816 / NCTC 3887 / NRRL 1 / QM 1276 / 107) TaxID=344612 RepID=A1CMV5_ASPCL|nr:Rab geranylgeranyl transferase escort protein, putative [Aspergillus clavatus NRRL 1]EAW08892.1 Rab geranylgeranyl transferase escort protein, putative [Aspergillus clavatus NRRL 1]